MKQRVIVAAVAAALSSLTAPAVVAQEQERDQIGETIVVTATRQKQRADEVLARVEVIDRQEIENAGQSTLVELLRSQPGIRISTNGGPGSSASIFMRGAESRHTLVLIDGMRIGSATTGQPTLEAIPLGIIDHIEIVRGPASALYGSEAIGGVIQIFTRKGMEGFHPEVFVGYGSDNTVKANASLAGGQNRFRYNITVGQDKTDGFNAKRNVAKWHSSYGSSYDPDDDGFRNTYVTGSAALGFRDNDEVGINVYQSSGRNWYDANDYYDSYLDKDLSTYGLYMTNQLAENWSSTLRLSQSRDKLVNMPEPAGKSRFETTQKQFVWQHDVSLPLGSLMAAYEYNKTEVDGTTDYTKDSRDVKAFLLGWSTQIGDHSLQVNARHDDNSQFGNKTTGLLGYGYQINRQWSVQASIASAFNAPTFNQLYYPDAGFGGGNPDLKPEKALNREIGLRWDDGVNNVEVTYFNNRVRDLISSWPPANVDKAKLEGLEFVYRTQLVGFDIMAGVDFLKAKDTETGKRLPRRSNAAAFMRVDRTVGQWSFGAELDSERSRYDDAANKVRMGGYGLVNAYAHYAFAPEWRLEMRANNILDKKYDLAKGYATEGSSVFAAVRYTPRWK